MEENLRGNLHGHDNNKNKIIFYCLKRDNFNNWWEIIAIIDEKIFLIWLWFHN